MTMEKNHLKVLTGPVQWILVGLLVIASFLVGSLYTKVKYLEKSGSSTGSGQAETGVKSKYKTFSEAALALALDLKLDQKKFKSCLEKGEKKGMVEADVAEGNSVGVSGTPAFFINGRFLGGAFPLESFKNIIDKEIAGKGAEDYKQYSQDLQNAYEQGAFNPKPKEIKVGNSAFRGTGGAPVVIIEFSDFQCPYCQRVNPTLEQIFKEYEGKVLFAFKHYPLTGLHPHAQKAAESAECARDQGKFWEMHDKLFETQGDWSGI